jgi:hypothetical protein
MINSADLVTALSPKLLALDIDAAVFAKAGDFVVFDAYPEHEGTTYRLRLEVDVRDGAVGALETYARIDKGLGNHDDQERDQSNTPASVFQSGVAFADAIRDGVAEFVPAGPKF